MERAYGQARLDDGTVVAGAQVRVLEQGTLVQATIYDDDLSPVPTLRANPFFADTNGQWFFYAANGRYDIVISGGTPPFPVGYTVPDYNLGLGDCGPAVTETPDLPPPGIPHTGRLRYDPNRGVLLDTGTEWVPLTGFGLPVVPFADLPTPGIPGRLRIVSDNVRGIWQDQGTYWFNIFGEVVNIQDFGAVGDGSADDTAAIQAAIDALAATGGGGAVLVPARTFGISAPLLLRNGTRLQGTSSVGSVIKALPSFVGDSMLRGVSRDDNTLSNFESVAAENLELQAPATSLGPFYCIDLTGWHRSVVSNVLLLGGGQASANQFAFRVADVNPTGTSVKDCISNRIEAVTALRWNTFMRCIESGLSGVLGVEDNTVEQFTATCRTGISFGGSTGGMGLSFAGGLLYGDSVPNAGNSAAILGTVPPFTKIDRLQVAAPFGDGDGGLADFRNTFFLNYSLGVGRSGTSEATAVVPFGSAPGPFSGSVFVKIPAGTALLAGRNLFTYTIPGMGSVLPVGASPAVFCQGFTFPTLGGFGGANSGDTLTLVVISTAPAVLIADTVFRVLFLV